jgi:hypothetical protein
MAARRTIPVLLLQGLNTFTATVEALETA